MKIFFILIICVFSILTAAEPTRFLASDINYQVNQYDPKLIKQFGVNGGDMLCWPSSLAHRLAYFKTHQFPRLKLKSDAVENVPHLKTLCRTSLAGGTSQKRKIPCITQAFREGGYDVRTLWLGVDSTKPAVAIVPSDITEALRKGLGVILHVGWLRLDSKKNWVEGGSHSVNAYGFQYDDDKLALQITNPGVNYSERAAGKMFDMVRVEDSGALKDGVYPKMAKLVLRGTGFERADRRGYVRNVFIFGLENSL